MTTASTHPTRQRGLLVLALGIATALALTFTITRSVGTGHESTAGSPAADAGGPPAGATTPTPDLPEDAPTNPLPPVGAGRTVVSLAFDDGTADQLVGAKALDAVEMPATFYVVSSWLDKPGHLSRTDLADLRMSGHEIGGHTTTHHDLAQLPEPEIKRQICNNRKNLQDWGLEPVSFAYPFSSSTPTAEAAVGSCGYDTARALGALRSPSSCATCRPAETLPPQDPHLLAAPDQVDATWTLADLQRRVTDAHESGGGWVTLTFHDVCANTGGPGCPASKSIDPALFKEFVQWLHEYRGVPGNRTSVATVGDTYRAAMGADHPGYRTAHAQPNTPVAPVGANGIRNPSLEKSDAAAGHRRCFERGGWGTNRATWSTVPGRTGGLAQRLRLTDRSSGDAKLMPTMDLGTCSPSVTPGRRYDLGTWYTSTALTQFALYYRTPQGQWKYWTSSPWFGRQKEWTRATWTTPPVPEDASAVSFGLALIADGTVVTDDYSMIDPGDR